EWFWDYYDTELFKTKIWNYIEKSETNLRKFELVFERVLGVGKWEYSFGKGMVHYNYRKIDEDVFGKAYEMYIAKSRKDSGIYYTHRLITQYMSEQLVKALFEPLVYEIISSTEKFDFVTAQNKMNELYNISIADTTSGSGSFLIKVFKEIYKYYNLIYKKLEWANTFQKDLFEIPQHIKDARNFIQVNNFNNKKILISNIILRHLYAIDIDGRALETAKTNLWKEAVKIEKGLFKFKNLNSNYNHILPNLKLNFIIDTIKTSIRQSLNKIFPNLTKATFICLEFFNLFFDKNGKALPEKQRGFSGIIGNPPWEEIYPVAKEFADIGKYEMDKKNFDREFKKKIKSDSKFKVAWEQYCQFYDEYTKYVYENYEYHKLKPEASSAMRSHLNYFKLLFERDLQVLKQNGFLNILIPSSFQTDEGSYGLRKLSLIENKLIELFSFENRGFKEKETDKNKTKIFPDVHPQFKFSIVFVQKQIPEYNHKFKTKFYLHHPNELYEKPSLDYSLESVKKFSPNNLSIMEFASQADYDLCSKILGNHKLLQDYGYSFRREFNVTDDSKLFTKALNIKNHIPVYEGKCIHQFTNCFSELTYFIDSKTAHKELISKETKRIKINLSSDKKTNEILEYFEKNNFILDYQTYRLVYRAVAGTTNERTLIATIIPPNTATVNSLNYLINCTYEKQNEFFLQKTLDCNEIIYLMALLNSLTLNYYIRNKISANLNMFYLYELPVPSAGNNIKKRIIESAFTIIYKNSYQKDFEKLKEKLNVKIILKESLELRAEIEYLIAKELFNLNKNDWEFLTSTFVYGEDSKTRKELDDIIKFCFLLF
ncbi:MAG: hypothetical protein HY738_10460, partial [Bacteroidia bacterium]|nr:hypothetical protein [Bacteroidia bacterium]